MMEEISYITPLVASILAAIVATSGIMMMRYVPFARNANLTLFTSFAAGILISVSFLHIIPEALEIAHDTAVYIVVGYFSMHVLNRFLTAYVCDKHSHVDLKYGLLPVIGIGLHSFIDGIVYSITFTHSIFTGAVAALGMISHEFAEGAVTYSLLVNARFKTSTAMTIAFFAAALSTPLGMMISLPFISDLEGEPLSIMLALSGGVLIYVGASHLLPHTEKEPIRYSFISLLAGIVMAMFISSSSGH